MFVLHETVAVVTRTVKLENSNVNVIRSPVTYMLLD